MRRALAIAVLAACAPAAEPEPARPGYTVVDVSDGGRIAGAVRANGRGVARAYVALVDIHAGVALVPSDGLLVRRGCAYTPPVQIMTVDSLLVVRNDDATLHEVRGSAGSAQVFAFVQPLRGQRSEQRMTKAETIVVEGDCGGAVVHVKSHPYATLTKDDGSFALERVPPGTYELAVWHDGARQTRTVTVTSGAVATVELVVHD